MFAYRVKTKISSQGTIQLDALPFSSGEIVEVIVLATVAQKTEPLSPEEPAETGISLKGSVLEYINPTEPVAQNDWAAAQ